MKTMPPMHMNNIFVLLDHGAGAEKNDLSISVKANAICKFCIVYEWSSASIFHKHRSEHSVSVKSPWRKQYKREHNVDH